MKSKHIVIDARFIETSTGRYIYKLVQNLIDMDSPFRYSVLVPSSFVAKDHFTWNADKFTFIATDIPFGGFSEQIKLAYRLYSLHPDLVHFPMVQQPLLYFGKIITTMQDLTALRFRNPSANQLILMIKQKVYWLINYIAPRKSAHVISISEFSKQDVMKTMRYNRPDKFTVTLESADELPQPGEAIQLLKTKEFITYVGRHQPHKNLLRLIEAHQKLIATHPDLFLAIVGKIDSVSKLVEENIAKQGYKNIIFTGFINDNQLRWLYENTACYVFPSLSEGFGLPGLEAMVHGAPVASSNATCLPEVYGDAALYFDPLSVDNMAEKISLILDDKKLRDKVIAKGKVQAGKYSWKRMAEQTLEVYRSSSTN